jgi:hypothetical protein
MLDKIKYIADQCPHSSGWPVYWARSIYSSYYPEVLWGLNEGCKGGREREGVDSKQINTTCIVYPNPANTQLNFSLSVEIPHDARFQLLDLNGRIVSESIIPSRTPSGLVPVQQLPEGLYLYRIITPDSTLAYGRVAIVR